jgi:hypothetical protein
MSTKNIWYGVLEAGEKTSPVVRDATLDASEGKVWLYNHVRDQFVEYAKSIAEPKLRDLTDSDIPQDELEKAFKAARKVFSSTHKVRSWAETKPAAKATSDEDDTDDFDLNDDDDMEDFIDDDD